ncbi:MAG TPA: acyl-CoA synthetase [Candidatus Dormibacteraeota bacterium]|nr:acyl-CoA synthetase [Candidatus Dormibacteraeota bacterium]
MMFALGPINEAIADAIPDQDAIITATRRLTWRDFRDRSRRLANLLHQAGLGCHRERAQLQPWESGQDHVAQYLYNGHEYLESMIGCYKARVAPFNVNYRYVEAELRYLLDDAKTKGVIYHASFAPRLAAVLKDLPPMAVLLQVDDGSGEPLLPGARDYEEALAAASDAPPPVTPSEDDLYILYTGGTTGMPKGVLWRQHDIFFAAMGGQLPAGMGTVQRVADMVERAPMGSYLRALPAPPLMHGAAQWSAFMILHQGGSIILPSNTRVLDADDIWRTVEREKVGTLSIVGDAFARPLLDQLAKGSYDLSSLSILGSGGAILSPPFKQAFLEHLPNLMIFDGFGSSETGAQGATLTTKGDTVAPSFKMDPDTCVLDEALTRRLEPGENAVGWLARTGWLPLGYLNDPEKTRKTYPTVAGTRYAVPGDRAQVAADGNIVVFGRDSVCINSGGEKIFAEEVEKALKHHPAVYDVVVAGAPSARWGEQVTAIVQFRPGQRAADADLLDEAAKHLARYKLPKTIIPVEEIVRSASGKPDYRWAKSIAAAGA